MKIAAADIVLGPCVLASKRLLLTLLLLAMASTTGLAQGATPTLYISPTDDSFEVYLTAAMHKKDVPVQVTTNAEGAEYTLKTAELQISKGSGAGKIARCLFAYCAGIADSASTSVTLVRQDGIVAWSYSVNKGRGAKNRQSLAEAIAKHLNDDFLKKLPKK